jgi:ribosomal protein S18 acetylase RimI-like enzyme
MDLNYFEMNREHTRHTEGGEVTDLESMTCVWMPHGEPIHNMALVRGPIDLATLDRTTDQCYRKKGRHFSLFLRAHADHELEAALEGSSRYRYVFSTPGMALLPEAWRSASVLPDLAIRPVQTQAECIAYGALMAEAYSVYGISRDAVRPFFTRTESLASPNVQGFLGYVDERPVTGAILYASHGVAGVGWVGTHPEFFGRRYAEAVTAAVVEEGFRRGLTAASLQASPMGRPVYARMGFETPTEYKMYLPLE